jgi:hypothetical protein
MLLGERTTPTGRAGKEVDMSEITWLTDVDEARRVAEREDKLVLLDFFSPV